MIPSWMLSPATKMSPRASKFCAFHILCWQIQVQYYGKCFLRWRSSIFRSRNCYRRNLSLRSWTAKGCENYMSTGPIYRISSYCWRNLARCCPAWRFWILVTRGMRWTRNRWTLLFKVASLWKSRVCLPLRKPTLVLAGLVPWSAMGGICWVLIKT